jgi:hypothetical protein
MAESTDVQWACPGIENTLEKQNAGFPSEKYHVPNGQTVTALVL